MFVIKVYGLASENNPVYEMHGCVHEHACMHVFLESCVQLHVIHIADRSWVKYSLIT